MPDAADSVAGTIRTLMIDALRRRGRYIGGSPPYSYCLAHDQPHHNPGKAARGERQGHLQPDHEQTPVPQEILQRTLAGDGQTNMAQEAPYARVAGPRTGRLGNYTLAAGDQNVRSRHS